MVWEGIERDVSTKCWELRLPIPAQALVKATGLAPCPDREPMKNQVPANRGHYGMETCIFRRRLYSLNRESGCDEALQHTFSYQNAMCDEVMPFFSSLRER